MLRAETVAAGVSTDTRVANADRATFLSEVVQRYEAPLLRFLYGLVQDRELAADLCQETFLAAFRALPRMQDRELKLSGWLYTIALNQARGSLRRRRLLTWIPFMPGIHERQAPGLDVASRLALRDELRQVLGQLPVEQRACLLLHAEGFRYAEIAQVLGCSVDAVKVRVFRARRRCLELLDGGAAPSNSEGL